MNRSHEEEPAEYAFNASATGTYSNDGVAIIETTHNDQSAGKQRMTGEVARVKLSLGGTYNIGNFESIRVDVAIEMPCAPNRKSIQTTYDRLNVLVSDYLADQVQQMQAEVAQHRSQF